ncbi:MAG: phosphatidylserine/phosphatidylglycerophosphate/cardiolipin synthase family protein [Gemmatimonadota bacterium]
MLAAAVLRDLASIAGSEARAENAIRILVNGTESFGAMLEMVRTAACDLRLENFIFRKDAVGGVFAEELRVRGEAGVRVRVLHDPVGAVMARRRPVDLFFRGSPVAVRLFNVPLTGRGSRHLGRDHRKLVLADRSRMVIGGICLADPWAGNCIRHCTWRDSALYVEGRVAGDAAAAFEEGWKHGWQLFRGPNGAEVEGERRPSRQAGGIPARLVADLGRSRRTLPLLERVIDAAEAEVLITTPYFIPPPPLATALRRAVSRGVAVSVLIPGASNHRVAALSGEHGLGSLLACGVRVFLWQGAMIHAKSVVVDGLWTLVGSSNLDPLSLIRNAELNVEVHGSAVGRAMAELFREDCRESVQLTFTGWRKRALRRRLAGRLAAGLSRWQ